MPVEVPFGNIRDGVLYRNALKEHDEVRLTEISDENLKEKIAFFESSFEKLNSKLKDVESKIIDSNNKASFLSSLLNLKDKLVSHEGLGDYDDLNHRIDLNVSQLNDYIHRNRRKNTEIKVALLQELDQILQNNDMDEATLQIKDLKARWIKTGSPEDHVKEELESKFKEDINAFFHKKNSFNADKKELIDARVVDYKSIIAQIDAILKGGQLSSSYNKIIALQSEWKEIGRVPESVYKGLNEKYWALCKAYFDQKKSEQKELQKSRSANKKESLAQRTKVIADLEQLLEESLFSESVGSRLKDLTLKWKNAGALSRKDNPEIHNQYLKLFRGIQERQFVFKRTKSKFGSFASKPRGEQLKALLKATKELLRRDETELSLFKENLDKMHINKGSFVEMLESKLNTQQEKVETKRSILADIESKMKEKVLN